VHLGLWLLLIGNPVLEVGPTGQRGRTATKSGRNGWGISFRRYRGDILSVGC